LKKTALARPHSVLIYAGLALIPIVIFGIADLHRRARVSQKAHDRLLNALASVDDRWVCF